MLFGASIAAAACDGARPLVAVAADQNAVLVANSARTAGIAELGALAAPSDPAARPASRFAPVELTVYEVSGTLLAIDRQPDGDYRLVIDDRQQPPAMLIAVAAAADCADDSRYADNIRAVRRALDRQFGSFQRVTPNLPVTATGIAYFAARGQPGAAANGVELRPLIGVAFP
jgi:hypothetical protein